MSDKNKLSILVNFILNAFIHITALFTFLFILYYFIVSPLTENLLHSQLGDIIDNIFNENYPKPIVVNLDNLLFNNRSTTNESFTSSSLAPIDKNTTNYLLDPSNPPFNPNLITPPSLTTQSIPNNFDKNKIKREFVNPYLINNLIEQYSYPDNILLKNNETVIYFALYISACLIILSVALTISFKFSYSEHVNISHILLENLLVFSLIGYIEYWFFTTYAFKFSPLLPSELSTIAIQSINNQLNSTYQFSTNVIPPPYTSESIPIILS